MMNKCLVVARRALVDSADVIEHVGFTRQVADVPVYRKGPAAGRQCFGVAALVAVDAADVVVQDRLVLRSAYLTKDLQRFLIGVERVPVITIGQVHRAQIVVRLRFPATVTDVTIERQRLPHRCVGLGITAQEPAGDTGMAQGISRATRVRGSAVQQPCFLEVGERLTRTSGALVSQAYLVEGRGLAAPVGQRPVDRRGFLRQGDRRLVPPGLLAHGAERQRRPRDPGRIGDIPAGLQGEGMGGRRLVPVRPDLHEVSQQVDEVGALALPFVPARVARGLQDVAPLRFQPGCRVFLGTQGRAPSGQLGRWHRSPAPQRVQDPVGPVGGEQVVVEEPAHGLPLLGPGVVFRGARGRIAVDEVVEAELLAGDLGQQVMIQQGDECLLRLGEGTAGQRGRGQQAEAGARTDAKPPEELLVVGLQRTVGQIEGGDHLWGVQGRHARIAEPRRGVRQFVDQAAEAGRAILRDPAGGELDRQRQPPAQFSRPPRSGRRPRPGSRRRSAGTT